MFKLGLIINPYAGVGGAVALKGSDGADIVAKALQRGAEQKAEQRAAKALSILQCEQHKLHIFTYAGSMGEHTARAEGFTTTVIGEAENAQSSAEDTRRAAKQLKDAAVDLLLFVGGDGTARDIFNAVGHGFPVLGVPAGVKMHSGVYAVSPEAAGELVLQLIQGQLVDIGLAEVRDIDEAALRDGRVQSRFYGELTVPKEGRFLQQVKSSGREVEDLVIQDIAADIIEGMDEECLYIIGAGTTPQGIMEELGHKNTLLGVDVIKGGELLLSDATEGQLLTLLHSHQGRAELIVSIIGGQGHIFGRGNQQLSADVIRAVGISNIRIVASKTKITELEGRPLLVDTNDPQLDRALVGYHRIITGYHDAIMYPLGISA